MRGHLFVTQGHLEDLRCDAMLIPSGIGFGGRLGHVAREEWWPLIPAEFRDADGMVTPAPTETGRVVRLPIDTADTTGVWIGHSGQYGQTAEWYAKTARAFVREASARGSTLTERPLVDERPLLALPLVASGLGGAGDFKGALVLATVTAIQEELAATAADVVLVLSEPDNFAAAQHARLLTNAAWADLDDPRFDERAQALAEHARTGHLVLFVGAGASIGAGAPSWGALLRELAEGVEGGSPIDLDELEKLDARDQAALLSHRHGGRAALVERVREKTTLSHISLTHQLLASLPISEAVTTNYDTCLERAMSSAGRAMKALPREPVGGSRRWLLKLHGCVEDRDRIVLSRDDYLRFEEQGTALAGIVQALLLTRHMLFVGYSLKDDNFARLVHQVRTAVGTAETRPDTEPFATAIATTELGLFQDLWKADIDWVSTATTGSNGPRRAAIFLDRVVALASSPAAHMLDPSFDALFTQPAERDLRRALVEVWTTLEHPDVSPHIRDAVAGALARIGERPR